MPADFFLHLAGVGNHPQQTRFLEQVLLQAQHDQVKEIEALSQALAGSRDQCPAAQPFPVTAVSGPVHVLPEGALQAKDQLLGVALQQAPHVNGIRK